MELNVGMGNPFENIIIKINKASKGTIEISTSMNNIKGTGMSREVKGSLKGHLV